MMSHSEIDFRPTCRWCKNKASFSVIDKTCRVIAALDMEGVIQPETEFQLSDSVLEPLVIEHRCIMHVKGAASDSMS